MSAPNREQFTNNASTTLNGGINNSVTSITVTDGSVFPSSGNFRIIVESEIMVVTARSTNTLTVVRGQEGTAAASHSDSIVVTHIVTADSLDRLGKDNVILFGSSAPPLNKLVGTDGATLLTTSDFSWTNQGGAAVSDQNGTIVMRAPATSGNDFRLFRRTAPSPPWTLITAFRPHVQGINGSSINCQLGMILRQSSSGKFISFAMNRQSTAQMRFAVDHWSDVNNFGGSTPFLGANQIFLGPVVWSKLVDDNTNLKWSISDDGIEWIQVYSATRTTFMTTTGPDQFGVCINNGGDASGKDALLRLLHWHTE